MIILFQRRPSVWFRVCKTRLGTLIVPFVFMPSVRFATRFAFNISPLYKRISSTPFNFMPAFGLAACSSFTRPHTVSMDQAQDRAHVQYAFYCVVIVASVTVTGLTLSV